MKRPHSVSSCRSRHNSFRSSFHGSFRQKRLPRQRSVERPEYIQRYSVEYMYTLPPLFVAASECSSELVKLLVKYGACVNVQDHYGNSPLHLSVSYEPTILDCTVTLIECGSRIAIANHDGVAPIDIAPELVRVQRELVEESLLVFLPNRGRLVKEDSTHTVVSRLDSSGSGARSSGILKRFHHDLAKGKTRDSKRTTRESSPDDSVFMSEYGHGEAPSATSDHAVTFDKVGCY